MVATTAVPASHPHPPAPPRPASPADGVSHSLKGETLAATLWLGRAFNNISQNGPSKCPPIFEPYCMVLTYAI